MLVFDLLPVPRSTGTLVSDELHEATDDLNAAIVRAEEALARLKLGVTASAPFPITGDDPECARRLAFGKMGDRWRFIVESAGAGPVPLLNASRLVRLRAVDLFDQVLRDLLAEVERETKEAREMRERADAFTSKVGLMCRFARR